MSDEFFIVKLSLSLRQFLTFIVALPRETVFQQARTRRVSGLERRLLSTQTTTKWFKKIAGGKLVSLRRASRHPGNWSVFPRHSPSVGRYAADRRRMTVLEERIRG